MTVNHLPAACHITGWAEASERNHDVKVSAHLITGTGVRVELAVWWLACDPNIGVDERMRQTIANRFAKEFGTEGLTFTPSSNGMSAIITQWKPGTRDKADNSAPLYTELLVPAAAHILTAA